MTRVYWYYKQTNDSPLVTTAYLARERAVQLPGQYAREHENTVVDAADSFTSVAEVDHAMGSGWAQQVSGQPGMIYEHFWDLGAVHDPTVGGVGHLEGGVLFLDHLVTFQGSRERPVLLPVVKQAIKDLAQRFPPTHIRIESWQGLSTAQELTGEGLPVALFTPTAKSNSEEWPTLSQRLSSRSLVLFPHARLREELLNLTYEVGPSGVRVIDKGRIHQDHAVALRGVCAGLAAPMLPAFIFSCGGVKLGGSVAASSPVPVPSAPVHPQGKELLAVSAFDLKHLSPAELEERARLVRAEAPSDNAIERAVARDGYWWPRT